MYSAAGLAPISKESFFYNINHPQTEEALKSLQYSRSILAGIHLHLFSVTVTQQADPFLQLVYIDYVRYIHVIPRESLPPRIFSVGRSV